MKSIFSLNRLPETYIKDQLITHQFSYARIGSDIKLNITLFEWPNDIKKTIKEISTLKEHISQLQNDVSVLDQQLTSKYNL